MLPDAFPSTRIIPVIDLKHGQVVRGIAGRRDEYQPVARRIVAAPTPAAVAKALANRFGFREVYVADLDAIAGAPPDHDSYVKIAAAGLGLWVDAGIGSAERAAEVAGSGNNVLKIVVGLESMAGRETLDEAFTTIPSGKAVFSLDLKNGVPLTQSSAWMDMDAADLTSTAIAIGFTQVIVLDLAFVGTGNGIGIERLCRQLKQAHPHVELIGGGGVRGLDDVRSLAAAGCDAVLVASALHNGRLTRRDVETAARWNRKGRN